MEKNIVEVVSNNKGEVIEKVADYIGVEAFAKEIESLYRECLDEFDNKEELEQYINDLYDDEDHIHNLALEFTWRANRDMKKYLHQKDHSILGNLMDVELNYTADMAGTHWISDYDGHCGKWTDIFPNMVKRLDSGEDSEQAISDREYLMAWFFSAFGTFGIKYNFSNELDDLCYELETDKKDLLSTEIA